jgi:hypothetical protein
MAGLIFVSCRIDDFPKYGVRICASLIERYGKRNVILLNGATPPDHGSQIGEKDALVVIIGQNWKPTPYESEEVDRALSRRAFVIVAHAPDNSRDPVLRGMLVSGARFVEIEERYLSGTAQILIDTIDRKFSDFAISPFEALSTFEPSFEVGGLSLIQMVDAAQSCRRVRPNHQNDGRGEVLSAPQIFEIMVEARQAEARLDWLRTQAREATESLPKRRFPRSRFEWGIALFVTLGLGLAIGNKFEALVGWIIGALWHGATPPMPAVRPEVDVVDVIAFAPPSAERGERFLVQVFLGKTGEDEDLIRTAAVMSDPTCKRSLATLGVELSYGDRVDIKLEAANVHMAEAEQSLIWRRMPRSCAFLLRIENVLLAIAFRSKCASTETGSQSAQLLFHY